MYKASQRTHGLPPAFHSERKRGIAGVGHAPKVQRRWGSAWGTHHAGVHCCLLDVPGNAGHKGISVFKVCVKISLWVKQRDGD